MKKLLRFLLPIFFLAAAPFIASAQEGQPTGTVTNPPLGVLASKTLDDDFLGRRSFGTSEMDWATSGTCSAGTAVANHPGVANCTTAASAGDVNFAWLDNVAIALSDVAFFEYTFQPNVSTSNVAMTAGVQDGLVAGEAAKGVYFSYQSATSPNWRSCTGDGTTVCKDTGVPYALAYTVLRAKKHNTSWEFWIGATVLTGSLRTIHTVASDHIDSSTIFRPAIIAIKTTDGTAKSFDFDRWRLQTVYPLAR